MNWKPTYEAVLKSLGACDDARRYVYDSTELTFEEHWNACVRPDWMLWLSSLLLDRKLVVLTTFSASFAANCNNASRAAVSQIVRENIPAAMIWDAIENYAKEKK